MIRNVRWYDTYSVIYYTSWFHPFSLLIQTLSQVGQVMDVLPNGDVRVEVRGTVWTFNPSVVNRVDIDGAPLTPGTSRQWSYT